MTEVGRDTVVIQFVSDMKALEKDLDRLQKKAEQVGGGGKGGKTQAQRDMGAEIAEWRRKARVQSRFHTDAQAGAVRLGVTERSEIKKTEAERSRAEKRALAERIGSHMRRIKWEQAQERRAIRDRQAMRRGADPEVRLKALATGFGEYERSFRRANQSIFTTGGYLDKFAIKIDRSSLAMWKFTIAAMPLKQIAMATGVLAAAAGGLTLALAKEAAWLEVTRRQFANMTGSMAKANEQIEWLREQAPLIVYSLKEVMEAGRVLTSAGYDIQEVIYPMSDLAAGLNQEGIEIVSATRAFVDGMHGEIRRLKNTFNITTQDIIETTKASTWIIFQQLSVAERQAAILAAIQKKYPDANKAALESILGAWSDFKDRLINLAQDIGAFLLPPLQKIIDVGRGILGWFMDLPPYLKSLAAWATLLTAIGAGFTSVFFSMASGLVMFAGMIQAMRIWRSQSDQMLSLQMELARLEKQRLQVQMDYFAQTMPARAAEINEVRALVGAEETLNATRARGMGIALGRSAAGASRAIPMGAPHRLALEAVNPRSAIGRTQKGPRGTDPFWLWARQHQRAGAYAEKGLPQAALGEGQGPWMRGPSWPGRAPTAGRTAGPIKSFAASVAAFVAANALLIGGLAILAAVVGAVAIAEHIRSKRLKELDERTKAAAAALQEFSIIVPEEQRRLAKEADAFRNAFAGAKPGMGGAVFQKGIGEQLGQGGQLTAEQVSALKEWAAAAQKMTGEELGFAHAKGPERKFRAMLDEMLAAQTAAEMEDIKVIDPRGMQRLGLEMAEARMNENILLEQGIMHEKELLAVAKERLAVIDQEIAEEQKGVETGDQAALNKQRALEQEKAEIEAILKADDKIERLAKRIYGEYQGQWDAAKKLADVKGGIEEATDAIAKSEDITSTTLSKILSQYNDASAELAKMEDLNSKIARIADTEADTRRDIINSLREELRILGEMWQIAKALEEIPGRERARGMHGAAGGAGYVGAAGAARDHLIAARAARAVAAITDDEETKEKLLKSAYKSELAYLEAQADVRSGMAETRDRMASSASDELTQQRMTVQELTRRWGIEQKLHKDQMNWLRQTGASEAELNEAELAFQSRILVMVKAINDARRSAIGLVYDRLIAELEASRDLAGAMRDDAIEQARYAREIARLEQQKAQAMGNARDARLAEYNTMVTQYELQRTMYEMQQEAWNEERAYAKERTALAEDMAKKDMMTEEQVMAYRREEARFALAQSQREDLTRSERLAAYREYFNLINAKTDETKDKITGLITKIIGAPQDLVNKYLSPATMMKAFGGGPLDMLLGYGGSAPKPEQVVRVDLNVKFDPETLKAGVTKVAYETVERAFWQALPAFRASA